jgi:hypothetical protein
MSTDIEASPEQIRMCHGIAKTAAGEDHGQIRDRASRMFGVTSLKELTMSQMRQLIDEYQAMLVPEPVAATPVKYSNFGSLPKFTNKKPAAEPSKPATPLKSTQVATAAPGTVFTRTFVPPKPYTGPPRIGTPPPGGPPPVAHPSVWINKARAARGLPPVEPKQSFTKPRPHNFDPGLKIAKGDGLEDIPF